MPLDPNSIPVELHPLIGLAEEFGIGDDVDRPTKVSAAGEHRIFQLSKCLDKSSDVLYEWLCGPESKRQPLSDEFVAFVNLTMAVDHAQSLIEYANRTTRT